MGSAINIASCLLGIKTGLFALLPAAAEGAEQFPKAVSCPGQASPRRSWKLGGAAALLGSLAGCLSASRNQK